MAAEAGRDIDVYLGGQSGGTRLACREKGISRGSEPIDITDDTSEGWRDLLANNVAERQVNISMSGVVKDDTLRELWHNGNLSNTLEIVYADGGVVSGTFHLASYNETGAYQDAVTYEAEWQSSGDIAYAGAT